MLANGADLYFHIHNVEGRSADVDVGKTRVDSLVEVSKAGDEPHRPYSTTMSVQRYIKEVGHIPSITPPPPRLSLDTHVPWRTHTRTSTTCNPQPRYTTAAAAHLSPVTTTAAIYTPPLPPSMHRHHCRLRTATTAVYAPPPLPSTHRHHCRLHVTTAAPYVPPAAALYVPPPPPSFTSHHRPTLGAPPTTLCRHAPHTHAPAFQAPPLRTYAPSHDPPQAPPPRVPSFMAPSAQPGPPPTHLRAVTRATP